LRHEGIWSFRTGGFLTCFVIAVLMWATNTWSNASVCAGRPTNIDILPNDALSTQVWAPVLLWWVGHYRKCSDRVNSPTVIILPFKYPWY